jgi:hypothetical protein
MNATYGPPTPIVTAWPRLCASSTWPAGSTPPRLALLPLIVLLIVVLALSHGHVLWLAVPFAFFFFIGPRRQYRMSSGACR